MTARFAASVVTSAVLVLAGCGGGSSSGPDRYAAPPDPCGTLEQTDFEVALGGIAAQAAAGKAQEPLDAPGMFSSRSCLWTFQDNSGEIGTLSRRDVYLRVTAWFASPRMSGAQHSRASVDKRAADPAATPVDALGEQALAAADNRADNGRASTEASVVFRKSNLTVDLTYSGDEYDGHQPQTLDREAFFRQAVAIARMVDSRV